MNPHELASKAIVPQIINQINEQSGCYCIALAGESGCGKTETSKALANELSQIGIKTVIIGQDNYFYLPPIANDARRKSDSSWLGPHKEVNLPLLDETIQQAQKGAQTITLKHIDYQSNIETDIQMEINRVKVIIVEGTYTLLLKHPDCKIFIEANYHDTLPYRQLRNRGNEVHDPFVENILETEHKIIAGHRYLADIIIHKDYQVSFID